MDKWVDGWFYLWIEGTLHFRRAASEFLDCIYIGMYFYEWDINDDFRLLKLLCSRWGILVVPWCRTKAGVLLALGGLVSLSNVGS